MLLIKQILSDIYKKRQMANICITIVKCKQLFSGESSLMSLQIQSIRQTEAESKTNSSHDTIDVADITRTALVKVSVE